MRREKARVERPIRMKALARFGVPSLRLEPPPGSETGWPDVLFFIPGGKPFLLEVKWPGYEPEPKQVYIHDMLEGLGYDIAWCDDEEAGLAAIQARVQQAGSLIPEAGDKIPPKQRSRRAAP